MGRSSGACLGLLGRLFKALAQNIDIYGTSGLTLTPFCRPNTKKHQRRSKSPRRSKAAEFPNLEIHRSITFTPGRTPGMNQIETSSKKIKQNRKESIHPNSNLTGLRFRHGLSRCLLALYFLMSSSIRISYRRSGCF